METNKQIAKSKIIGYAHHKIILDKNKKPIDYIFLEANKTFEKITGLNSKKIIGKTVREVIPEIGNAEFNWINFYGKIALQGGEKEFEQFSQHLNKWYRVYVYSNRKRYFTTLFFDVSNIKQKEKLQSDLEEIRKIIFENIVDAIYLYDLDNNRIADANTSFLNLLGYTKEEIYNLSLTDFIAEDKESIENNVRRILEIGEIKLSNRHWRKKDGSIIIVEVYANKIQRNGNNYMLVIGKDVTHKILEHQKLEETRLRQIKQFEILSKVALSKNLAEGNIKELAFEITELVAKEFGIERVGVWLFNDDETLLENIEQFFLSTGEHSAGAILKEQEFKDEFNALKNSKYVDANDPLTDPRTAGYVEGYLKPHRITSMLDAVIRKEGKNYGTLCFEHVDKKHHWENDEINFACQLADQISLAIANQVRRKFELALIESEKQYKNLFNNAADAIFIADAQTGIILDANQKASELLKLPVEKIVGMHQSELHPIETNSEKVFQKHVQESELHNKTTTVQIDVLCSDGMKVPVEIIASQIQYNGKNCLMGIFRDITERKQAEEKLRQSEIKYRAISEDMPVLICRFNPDFNINYVNKYYCNYFGVNFEDLVGKSFLKFIPEDERENVIQTINSINYNNPILTHVHRVYRSNNIYWHQWTNKGIFDSEGNLVEYQSFGEDITQQKLLQESLQKSETEFRNAFEYSPIGIALVSPEGKWLRVNRKVCEILGYDKDELMNLTFQDITHPDDLDLNLNNVKKMLTGEIETYQMEKRYFNKNGNIVWVLLAVSLVKDKNGKPLHFISQIEDITERKKMVEEIKLINDRLELSMQIANWAWWQLDLPSGKVIFHKHKAEMLGYSHEEFNHYEDFTKILHPDDYERVMNSMKMRIDGTAEKYETEYRIRTKSGEYIWFYDVGSILSRDEYNMVIGGLVINITDRKKKEEHIIKLLKFSQALNDISNFIISSDGKYSIFTRMNETFGETLNVERTAVYSVSFSNQLVSLICEWVNPIATDIYKFEPDYPLEYFKQGAYKMMTSKSAIISHYDFPDEAILKDGSYEILHNVMGIKSLLWYPFSFNDDGFFVIVINSFREKKNWSNEEIEFVGSVSKQLNIALNKIHLTEERQKVSQALEESELKFRNIFETANEGIAIFDKEMKVKTFNKKFATMLQYENDELTGLNFLSLIFDEDAEDQINKFKERSEGKIGHYERRMKRKDGSTIWCIISSSPVFLSDGSFNGSFALFTDITDLKKIEEELITAKEKAEEMNRVKSYFFANMSHELRTPLVGILGFADLLKDELQNNPELERMASTIIRSANRLKGTLNLILSISKLESGKHEMRLSQQNLIPIIKSSFQLFQQSAKQKNLSYKLELPDQKIYCKIDENMLQNILDNLINNAIKFTNSGGVTVKCEKNEHFAKIHIIDTGIGIPKEFQNVIWEEFRQVSEGLNRSFEGTGLGLTIVKKFTELMNGKVYLESEVGVGSKFTIEFPIISES